MPSSMHDTMGRLSYASLSGADKKAWGLSPGFADCTPAFLRRRWSPSTTEEKMGVYSFLLDELGWCAAQWERYPQFLLPGLKPVPHGLADRDMSTEGMPDPESRRVVLRHFVPLMIETLRAGKVEEAALFGGLLAHFIQDSSSFGHQLPNSMYYDYFPEDQKTHVLYHHRFDDCDPPLAKVKPTLLGTTAEEVVFRLGVMGERADLAAKRMFIPMVGACRSNNRETMNGISQPALQGGVFQVASLWHTALAIGLDRIDPEEASKLGGFDLRDAVSYSTHPGMVGGYAIVPIDRNILSEKLMPLVLDFGDGPVKVQHGFGMTSFNSVKFLLEPGAFAFVEGTVGLSSRYRQDQVDGMNVEFFIGLDQTHNRVVSTELDYGPTMKKALSCRLTPGKPPERFKVPLGNAKTLIIAVMSWPTEIDGEETCHYPHIVVADPMLTK